jgi:hypothetical protein
LERERAVTRLATNYWAVGAAAIAVFIASSIWYVGFGGVLATLSPAYADMKSPSGWVLLGEFLRNLVISYALAHFVALARIDRWRGALGFGAGLWVFPTVILVGSVIHERYPLMLAAIHAGDWLIKLLVITLIVGVLRRKPSRR